MNIAIIGPGSVGLLLAGYIQQTDANLTLIDHKPERARILNKKGILCNGMDGDFNYKIPVKCGLNKDDKFDLVIVCVKAYNTEDAAHRMKNAGYKGPVLTMQNGLGNVDILKKIIPGTGIIAGITSEGANMADIGHVRHAGKGDTIFGEATPGNPGTGFIEKLKALLNKTGLKVSTTEDVDSLIWSKLIINVGINALTAILNVQNGKLNEIGYTQNLMKNLVDEALVVADKKNIRFPYNDAFKKVKEVCDLTALNYSSMFQDIKNRKKTEIDFINGAIVREGKKLGLPCPFNQNITDLIHALESFNK